MDGSRDEAPAVERPQVGTAARAGRHVCSLVQPDEALDREWDALALAVGASPFVRPGWVRAWMAAFSPRRPLRALVVRRDGELVALLPVLVGRRGLTVPVNSETSVMEPLAADDAARAELVSGLVDRRRSATLRYLPDGEAARLLLATAEARGVPVRRQVLRHSPYTLVDSDWETFQRSTISAKRRRNVRNLDTRLRALDELTLERHDGRRDLDALLSQAFGLEVAGWKGRQGTAVLSRPATEAFYRAAAAWAAQAGILRLYVLRLDGRAVAFDFLIEHGGVLYGVKKAYDEELRQCGPGFLLTHRILEDACRSPEVRIVEWQGQDELHKLELASGVRTQLVLQLFSPGPAGLVERGLATAVSAADAEVRRRLPLERRQQIRRVLHRIGAAVPSAARSRDARGRGA